jgi:flagellar motility protein MotE (MotC chaperone)
MSVDKIQELVNSMNPDEAASAIALVMKNLFSLLDEEARLKFVMNLVGESGEDKVASLVHL